MHMTIEMVPDFGNRVRAVLALRGQKASAFADEIGVSKSFLSRIFSGDKKPSKPIAIAMEAKLGPAAWAFVVGETNDVSVLAVQS